MNYLLIDDDPTFTQVLCRALERRGNRVLCAIDSTASRHCIATAIAGQQPIERVVLDLKLADESGLTLLPELAAQLPDAEIVLLTGYSSISTAVEAIKYGARDYLCKPAGVDEIIAAFSEQASRPSSAAAIRATPPSVERLEWEHIQRVLGEQQGNISATARALGMHRRTLQRKLAKRPVRR